MKAAKSETNASSTSNNNKPSSAFAASNSETKATKPHRVPAPKPLSRSRSNAKPPYSQKATHEAKKEGRDDQDSKISKEVERKIKFDTDSGLTDSGLADSGLTDSGLADYWVADSGFADLMLNDALKTSTPKDKKRRIIINASYPFYVEVSHVPAHGNASYVDVDFFKKVRSRYYILSTQ